MRKIINKPYLFFWGLIFMLLLIGLIKGNEIIDVNIYDAFFVMSILHLSLFLSFLAGILCFGYWIVLKLKKKLVKVLSFLHVSFTFFGGVVLLITYMIPNYSFRSNYTLLDSLGTINVLRTTGVLLIVFGQVFYPFNIIFSLFRKK